MDADPKLTGWSVMVIVPAFMVFVRWYEIRRSTDPIGSTAFALGVGLVVGGIAWAILAAADRRRRAGSGEKPN